MEAKRLWFIVFLRIYNVILRIMHGVLIESRRAQRCVKNAEDNSLWSILDFSGYKIVNFGYSRHAADPEYSRFPEQQICNIEYFLVL